jgi:hypothetical protein
MVDSTVETERSSFWRVLTLAKTQDFNESEVVGSCTMDPINFYFGFLHRVARALSRYQKKPLFATMEEWTLLCKNSCGLLGTETFLLFAVEFFKRNQ